MAGYRAAVDPPALTGSAPVTGGILPSPGAERGQEGAVFPGRTRPAAPGGGAF